MAEHYDLLIRNGTCVLPWGMEAADIGVRNGRIAGIGVAPGATAGEVIDAAGLHVLPGLIDPHVHLRDPGDAAVETIPTGTRGAILGGLTAVFDMPNTTPSIVDAEKLAWKQGYVEQVAWCDMGLYVGGFHAPGQDAGAVADQQVKMLGHSEVSSIWRPGCRTRHRPGPGPGCGCGATRRRTAAPRR